MGRNKTVSTFTLAGDESGDVSQVWKGSVLATSSSLCIATPYPDRLRSELEVVRKEANLPSNYEFKFHSLTPPDSDKMCLQLSRR